MKDEAYLATVYDTLKKLLTEQQPDMVLYDAGVDIFTDDPLGLLNISLEGIQQRDRLVLQMCKDSNIPVATVIGGGYDDDRLALARRHALVTEAAFDMYL